MAQMIEQWLPIAGYEGLYEVSNLGRVKSLARKIGTRWGHDDRVLAERILRPSGSRTGYLGVTLCVKMQGKRILVHRLVASAFLANPSALPQVNHKDGDKSNNSVDNLEWCSGSTNCQHARTAGLYQPARGERSGGAKLTEMHVRGIRFLADYGAKHQEIADYYGVGRKAITKIVNRQRWAHVA